MVINEQIEYVLMVFHEWISDVFHKEGIAIFAVITIAFFMFALFAAVWAVKSGQFDDMELSKLEILDEAEFSKGELAA